MEGMHPLMSTPVSAKHSAYLTNKSTDLPSEFFDFFNTSGSFQYMNMESPETPFSTPQSGIIISCRHSPRLLSNGYYILDESSYLCDEESDGDISLSPLKAIVSYKEKIARIFRRRRKHVRRSLLEAWNNEVTSSAEDGVWEEDTGTFKLSYHLSSENDNGDPSPCQPGRVPQTDRIDFADESYVSPVVFDSGGFLCGTNDEHAYSYDVNNCISPMQPVTGIYVETNSNSQPGDDSSVTSIIPVRNIYKDSLKKEFCERKKGVHHVTLLFLGLIVILASLWLGELIFTLVTYVLLITLLCLRLQPKRRNFKNKIS
ncbi:transmembrane protein 71 [Bombina bombina]|uniref:transmembrane protein 71 n=1 Tax=Bombina bombina TaxID=8345 RepID=UPI00235B2167|nr:transmembrane protein 71 [Bombina bombina]